MQISLAIKNVGRRMEYNSKSTVSVSALGHSLPIQSNWSSSSQGFPLSCNKGRTILPESLLCCCCIQHFLRYISAAFGCVKYVAMPNVLTKNQKSIPVFSLNNFLVPVRTMKKASARLKTKGPPVPHIPMQSMSSQRENKPTMELCKYINSSL